MSDLDPMLDARKIIDDHRNGRMLISCEVAYRAALELTHLHGTLKRIDTFITAAAPTKLTKELDSIRSEVRAAIGTSAS